MKYLGIDYGSKKIGLALSDDGGNIAFPHSIIPNDAKTLGMIIGLIESEEVGEIVIGNSLSATGEENVIMKQVHNFVEALRAKTLLPVHLVSEYGTTGAARSLQSFVEAQPRNQATKRRTEKTKQLDDSAAAFILERYLESQNPRV